MGDTTGGDGSPPKRYIPSREKSKRYAAKFFYLTPKGYRHLLAIQAFEETFDRLSKLSDEEIVKLAEKNGDVVMIPEGK